MRSAHDGNGDKKNAARAIKRLHNKFMFPDSSRDISVRYVRKNSYNTPSAKNPPSQKPSKVTWSFYLPHSSYNSSCVFYSTQATTANRQLRKKSYNAPSAKINQAKSHRRYHGHCIYHILLLISSYAFYCTQSTNHIKHY